MSRFQVLREVARLYTRQQRQAVACCGGTSLTQCWIVTELGRAGSLTLGQLAAAIGFDKSWTSRAVDVLVADGLLAKHPDTRDARKISLSLTAKGNRRLMAINAELDAHARRVVQRIPAGKRQAVQDSLLLLQNALREEMACER
jgi:DNA-binding MarR family transcriptional regulator